MRIEPPSAPRHARPGGRAGAFTVEFALTLVFFLALVFAMLELGRAVYLWNTLQEVTRRAARGAAIANFADPAIMDQVRQRALLRASPGALALGGALGEGHVRIDYLALDSGNQLQAIAVLPACPPRNLVNCQSDPHGASCIRFVRVRICLPGAGSACQAVPYQPMVPWVGDLFAIGGVAINLPQSTTVTRAETLGYRPGMALCP
ncbi:MAG: TadE family protein [Pseudomonadota bacterium]